MVVNTDFYSVQQGWNRVGTNYKTDGETKLVNGNPKHSSKQRGLDNHEYVRAKTQSLPKP